MEGVARGKVRLLPHSDSWDGEFLLVKDQLQEIWSDNLLDIQHVGSTAIPAICAKPVLDVAVLLKSVQAMNIECLKALGYDYCGIQHGNENYHLFVLRGEYQISLRHIHCYDRKEKEFGQLTGFRDYLNTHRDAAVLYENLKRKLAEQYPDDRIAYTRGKEQFIRSIYNML